MIQRTILLWQLPADALSIRCGEGVHSSQDPGGPVVLAASLRPGHGVDLPPGRTGHGRYLKLCRHCQRQAHILVRKVELEGRGRVVLESLFRPGGVQVSSAGLAAALAPS